MKVINLKMQAKNSRFYSLVLFTRPHEKQWKRKHSSYCFVSQHFFTWGWDQKSINFDLQWEEESDFLHAVAIQAGQKFQSNFWRKQIFVIFNDCQDMLQNVDEIISQPFPVNWVFNFETLIDKLWGWFYFTIIFLDYNQIARPKVLLKVVLNLIVWDYVIQNLLWHLLKLNNDFFCFLLNYKGLQLGPWLCQAISSQSCWAFLASGARSTWALGLVFSLLPACVQGRVQGVPQVPTSHLWRGCPVSVPHLEGWDHVLYNIHFMLYTTLDITALLGAKQVYNRLQDNSERPKSFEIPE